MTNTIITSYVALLLMGFAFLGMSFVHASEVTGTLSSDASSNSSTDGSLGGTVGTDTETSGNISGTVSSGSSGGGGGRGSSGGSSNSSSPDGSVLGATTDNVTAPSFPNAGFAPGEEKTVSTLWSRMITFFSSMVSSVR